MLNKVSVGPDLAALPDESGRRTVAIAVYVVSGIITTVLFWRAYAALDRIEPLDGIAAGYHWAVIFVTVAAIAVSPSLLAARPMLIVQAVAVALPLALFVGSLATTYDVSDNPMFAALFFMLRVMVFVALILPVFVGTILSVAFRRPPSASVDQMNRRIQQRLTFALAFVGGWGIAVANSLASAYILMTLPRQVQDAEAAHRMPALEFIGVVLILAWTAWMRRKR